MFPFQFGSLVGKTGKDSFVFFKSQTFISLVCITEIEIHTLYG